MTVVRPAQPSDGPAIRAVHLSAFPTHAEADLAEWLDRDGDAAISLVAEIDGVVVGHVVLSRMEAEGDGRNLRALGLGPVAARPDAQRRGVGGALIRAAIEAARARGEEIVFVLGEPDYYRRFGFSPETARPFQSPYAGRHFMALALSGDARPASGSAAYAPAFRELAG